MTLTEPTASPQDVLKDGKVVAIAGPVVDVEFPADAVPAINTALEMTIASPDGDVVLRAEVAQQIGHSRVRAVCLRPTDGMVRGTPVTNLGHGLTMPVGEGVLGHVLNVIGEPLDVPGQQSVQETRPILAGGDQDLEAAETLLPVDEVARDVSDHHDVGGVARERAGAARGA